MQTFLSALESTTSQGLPVPSAYKPLHLAGLGHAFTNTLLFLDCDRRDFPHPVVPFHVNCYGSMVMRSAGATAHLFRCGGMTRRC
jgi:hypothetical protein